MTKFNDLQTVKRHFFAFRNGVIADIMRKAGSPYKIIFGLNLPQLKEIAQDIGDNIDLATRLWDNSSTRESRLLAPMIYPVDQMTLQQALTWIADINDSETADMLCHHLLRKTAFADALVDALKDAEHDYSRYVAIRLLRGSYRTQPERAKALAEAELARNSKATKLIAAQLLDDIAFIEE